MTEPTFGQIVPATGEGWDNIPDAPNPFYLATGDGGMMLHKRMMIGRGIIPATQAQWSKMLPKTGLPSGGFYFTANPIPATLMGQVVNFFERTYDRQRTEAAILLTMHEETGEWRIYVPTQLVSHGGVNYVFDPNTIKRPWVIVGSIHSHCDFGAGHSSTDTGDAADFDGLHMTIGHIKDAVPQIVAMVAMNKKLFHYPVELFPKLFDYTEVKQHEAPAWWDRYVEDTKEKTKPVGFDLYAKFDKPTIVKSETSKLTKVSEPPKTFHAQQSSRFVSEDWTWNDKIKRMVHKSWTVNEDGSISYMNGNQPSTTRQHTGERGELVSLPGFGIGRPRHQPPNWTPEDDHYGTLQESREFNARKAAERGVVWSRETGSLIRDATPDEVALLYSLMGGEQGDKYWEDGLPPEVVESIVNANVLSDDEWDTVIGSPTTYGEVEPWQMLFLEKAVAIADALKIMGVNLLLSVEQRGKTYPIGYNLPDEQPTQQHGAH